MKVFELTREEYEKRVYIAKRKSLDRKRKLHIQDIENQYKRQKIETNKIIAIYLFLILNAIVIYAMVSMWVMHDLSYLGVLISDIGAQILVYAIYCLKAYHGKKQEEYLKYKRERDGLGDLLQAGSECEDSIENGG